MRRRATGRGEPGAACRAARLALASLVLAGCEAVPVVRFAVRESSAPAPTTLVPDTPGDAGAPPPERPIADAIILRPADDCTLDLDALAARIRGDARLTDRMHPGIGHGGDGGAWAMRTSSAGTAEYSELRLFPLPWVPPPTVERRFFVWAEGYEPRTVTIELGTASSRIDVPLTPSPAR